MRDYNKKPIILNNYDITFIFITTGSFMVIAPRFIFGLNINAIIFSLAGLLFIIFGIFFDMFLDTKIYFKQNCIEFHNKSHIVNRFELNNSMKDNLVKPFLIRFGFLKINLSNFIKIILFTICICVIIFYNSIYDFMPLFILLISLFVAKITFCLVVSVFYGDYFTLFPIIKLGEAQMLGRSGNAAFFGYFCIFLVDKKDYKDVKEYFINRLDIDIDKIDKTFL